MVYAERLLNAIDRQAEQTPKGARGYLGGSELGDACARRLWYKFRQFKAESPPAHVRRIFTAGHSFEDQAVKRLNALPNTQVVEKDWTTGKQFRSERFGGHVRSHFDGLIRSAYLSEPESWYLLEIKSYNKARFEKLEKGGVLASDPKYWSQVQFYLASEAAKERGITKALFYAECKDNGRHYGEEIEFDKMHALNLDKQAERVVSAQEPPERVANTPEWGTCRFCDFKDICWHDEPVKVTSCLQCKWAVASKNTGSLVCTNTASPLYGQKDGNLSPCEAFEGFAEHTYDHGGGDGPEG